MTEQKTTQETAPKAASARRNPPRPARQMRPDADAKVAAAEKVAAAWREMCQNEPLAVELLMPRELRNALGELAQVTAS